LIVAVEVSVVTEWNTEKFYLQCLLQSWAFPPCSGARSRRT